MRIGSHSNLTIELIHLYRFEVGCHGYVDPHRAHALEAHCPARSIEDARCVDRVELSVDVERCEQSPDESGVPCQALPPVKDTASVPEVPEPREISPLVGSPALSGLGVAMIVPGTLLDVVA